MPKLRKNTYAMRYVAGQLAEGTLSPGVFADVSPVYPADMPLSSDKKIHMLVWNILKQQRAEWQLVLKNFGKNAHLVLLQEAQTTPELVRFVTSDYLAADQVPALILPQHPSDVMTLASAHPIYCCPLRERELILRLPRSTLVTVYPLPDARLPMMVNIHAVNFSLGVDAYSKQLLPIGDQIAHHSGPVIMAGDFNVWSWPRMNALYRFAREMPLREVCLSDDQRRRAFGRPLGFMFYRGLSVHDASMLVTCASDHNPLLVEFSPGKPDQFKVCQAYHRAGLRSARCYPKLLTQPKDNTMTTRFYHDNVEKQLGSQASTYLISAVYASGHDLQRLAERLADFPQAKVLDMGCGAGHASFTVTGQVTEVTAYDLSSQMLEVVTMAAKEKGSNDIVTQQGYAETLPLADVSFDVATSRYSAHHWHDVGQALCEVKRVLEPGGVMIIMGVMSPGHPVRDVWLQTVETLRDTSHMRNYSSGEWLTLANDASLVINRLSIDRLPLEFSSWVARMRTPGALVEVIRLYQQSASAEVKAYFELQQDESFTSDTILFEAHKAV